MLKQRDLQRTLFEAHYLPNRVPADSFYGRLASVSDVLFRDQDLAAMYCPDNGRPCLPPSLMSGIMLLQFYDNVSDEEAMSRLEFDLRWKVALNLPLDFEPPHPSSLSVFRSRLLAHGEERYAFNRLVEVGRKAGFLHDKVTLLMDTTPQHGAGAVQDTYTLIRKGIRKLLSVAGYALPGKRQGLARDLRSYIDGDKKAAIDWSAPSARAEQLKVLVRDADAALELVEQSDDAQVRSLAWLLAKILGDDTELNEQGEPQIAQGVAEDRIVSLTDPEMRHGRKSAAQRFDGHKAQVVSDAESGLLLAVEPVAANTGDGRGLPDVVQTVEQQQGVQVERIIADGAYGSGDNRALCEERDIDLVSPQASPKDPEVHKSAFTLDVEARDAICPQGHHAIQCRRATDDDARPVLTFMFDRAACGVCPLFSRCVHSRTQGRCVHTHFHERLLRAARKRQETDAFRSLYALRSAIERAIAHLVRHGLRRARYIGTLKGRLQMQWIGALVNLQGLFRLCGDNLASLRQAAIAAR